MTPGQFLYHLYHRPVGRIRASLRNGGPFAERATEQARREMEAAAAKLPALPAATAASPSLHLLTGRRFWYQTAFCLYSFSLAAERPFHVDLYDDGSLDADALGRLSRIAPDARIHDHASLRQSLDQHLPAEHFPVLRDRWVKYPNIRKLVDVHLASRGPKLVLDSDLLFYRRPRAILAWLDEPTGLLHATDCRESYGYSRPRLESLVGAGIPALVNVGVCGLHSECLDWEELEAWTAELQRRQGTNYYLEQALVAMLAARLQRQVLPAADYITGPSRNQVIAAEGVMHHFVDTSKRWYFRHGWRHFIRRPETPP